MQFKVSTSETKIVQNASVFVRENAVKHLEKKVAFFQIRKMLLHYFF